MQGITIIAIGGGGFTDQTWPALDAFCLTQTGKAKPHLGYIGAASQDDPRRIARFHDRFEGLSASHIHLPMTLDAQTLADQLSQLDMVYVGGGNTEAMVAQWRDTGWDRVLCEAANAGLLLAGVSAGAVCWFEQFLFNDGTGPIRPLRGLGLIKGGACPHYSTETDRRAALHRAVADQTMPTTHAIDDGVAVLFNADGPIRLCTAEPGASAYHIIRDAHGQTHETTLSL